MKQIYFSLVNTCIVCELLLCENKQIDLLTLAHLWCATSVGDKISDILT